MQRRRGFGLVEQVTVLSILSLLIVFSLQQFSSQGKRSSGQGMALALLGELNAARARALASQSPVGFCVPSQGGSRPHARSVYLLEGATQPRRTRVVDYAREYPESVLAVAGWGAWTVVRPYQGEVLPANFPNLWLGGAHSDYVLIFTPDGHVTSNDLPLLQGSYHLAVAGALEFTPATPPSRGIMTTPPTYFNLTRVQAPQVIRISTAGTIELLSGLVGGESVPISSATSMQPAAAAASTSPVGNNSPVIQSIDVRPRPQLTTQIQIARSSTLSIRVRARDVDGEPLFVSWTSTPTGVAEPGAFSLPPDSPMEWSQADQAWVATVSWIPPGTAVPGNQFRLECTVSDPEGHSVSQVATALDPVQLVADGRILTQVHAPGPGEVFMVSEDGSRPVNLSEHPGQDYQPSFSPDGSQIVWTCDRDGSLNSPTEVYLMNSDGSAKRRITHTVKSESRATFSPDGSRLVYTSNLPDRLWCCNIDGSGAHLLTPGGLGTEYEARFAPTGNLMSFSGVMSAPPTSIVTAEIIVGEFVDDKVHPPVLRDCTNLTNNASTQESENQISWHPTSTNGRIVFSYWNRLTSSGGIETGRVVDHGVGSAPRFELVERTRVLDNAQQPVFSADGSKLLFMFNYPSPSNIRIADWVDDGINPPSLSNIRRFTANSYSTENPTDWARR